ncbi:MAG: GNAT family N-acetyltransferase [Carnobacterium sp.]|jgi:diamine N-acetyltransferase|uniref:Spermine/spermidine acetyltransferase n=1 Tax=Carnobacterium maltaromaticum LMA28 TaxID=1234679 RepID=K8E4J0_CARML|nr:MULTISPECIES: GNAT family N-acetyltransferase [Carnobacterium]AOA02209.1 spermidine acetyltransferase [Carnobacterium maltaromaticum]KRN65727.1 hypothetical protein IV70_GL002240 [Carnobacterium maltaromaticum DSM 20342]KRN72437.1 hypothetical protein IV76_GL002666 [Carnobacterium maltaromaticum]KRN87976.1 hypothetical protein IV75_GL002691 [Carnobacterium maltaromaticum]MBC9808109.1 GNAT family N-acetyltransferase [Carnobacterium maltaromaticum]
MKTEIRRVTKENWREIVQLKVAKGQENFIESNAESLLEAVFEGEDWVPVGLYSENQLVGFAMYGCYDSTNRSIWLDRFMIGEANQSHGLGKLFLEKICQYLPTEYELKQILLSFYPENQNARKFYEAYGFITTTKVDENGEEIYYLDVSH